GRPSGPVHPHDLVVSPAGQPVDVCDQVAGRPEGPGPAGPEIALEAGQGAGPVGPLPGPAQALGDGHDALEETAQLGVRGRSGVAVTDHAAPFGDGPADPF